MGVFTGVLPCPPPPLHPASCPPSLRGVSPAVTQTPMSSSQPSHEGLQRRDPPLKLYGFFQPTQHCLLWFLKALICRPFIQQAFSEPPCTAVPCLEDQEEASTELRSTMSGESMESRADSVPTWCGANVRHCGNSGVMCQTPSLGEMRKE